MQPRRNPLLGDLEFVAGNGLLHRRLFLTGGAALAATMSSYGLRDTAFADPIPVEPWMKVPTAEGFAPYGQPSKYESRVVRGETAQPPNSLPGIGNQRSPIHLLNGTITPNGLHFVRLHSGVPDI